MSIIFYNVTYVIGLYIYPRNPTNTVLITGSFVQFLEYDQALTFSTSRWETTITTMTRTTQPTITIIMVREQTTREEGIMHRAVVVYTVQVTTMVTSAQRQVQVTKTMHLFSIWWEDVQIFAKSLPNNIKISDGEYMTPTQQGGYIYRTSFQKKHNQRQRSLRYEACH